MNTRAEFLAFVRKVGIAVGDLPDASDDVDFAYNMAVATVNRQLCLIAVGPNPPGKTVFDVAVYNLATDILINTAADVAGAAKDGDGQTFFEALRKKWGINNFQAGVVNSASDQGTSTSLTVPKAAETFTLGDLQSLKTPYGRYYLTLAQKAGTLWGMT